MILSKLNRLVDRKTLSGFEIARIVMQCSVQALKGGEPAFSEQEVERIKETLSGRPREIALYNAWIEAAQELDQIKAQTLIDALRVQQKIVAHWHLLLEYFAAYRIKSAQAMEPLIMTETQARDYLAQSRQWQRQKRLAMNESLKQVVEISAYEKASAPLKKAIETHRDYRDYDQAIYAGWPVLEKHDPDKAKKLYLQARGQIQALYREGKITLDHDGKTDDLKEVLDKYFRGVATEAEIEEVIGKTSVSMNELYEAGLPEWIRWVDTYQADGSLDPDTPYGRQVAIIQEPEQWQLDEQGHYQPPESSWDYLLNFYRFLDREKTQAVLGAGNLGIRLMLKEVLARAAAIRVFTTALGIEHFMEDVDSYLNDLTRQIDNYNRELDRHKTLGGKILPPHLDLPALDLEDLEPDPEDLDDLREGLPRQVGEGWWEEALRHLEDPQKAERLALG